MLSNAQLIRSAHGPRTPAVEVTLDSGLTLWLRPILPSDKDGLRHGFDRLSDVSRYRRFLSPMTRLPDDLIVRFTEIDYVDHFAWVALDVHRPAEPGVGVARYIRNAKAPRTADMAIAIVDDYQGQGVGTLLMRMLCSTARVNSVDRLCSLVLWENLPMRRLLARLGARFRDEGGGVLSFDLDLDLLNGQAAIPHRGEARG